MRLTARFELTEGTRHIYVLVVHILHVEACHGYTLVYLSNGEVYKQSGNLAIHLRELQSSGLIFQTHRSHAVNIMHVNRIETGYAILSSGHEVPVSKGKEYALRNAILNL